MGQRYLYRFVYCRVKNSDVPLKRQNLYVHVYKYMPEVALSFIKRGSWTVSR